jgi:hypothetical protein
VSRVVKDRSHNHLLCIFDALHEDLLLVVTVGISQIYGARAPSGNLYTPREDTARQLSDLAGAATFNDQFLPKALLLTRTLITFRQERVAQNCGFPNK